MFKYRFVNTEEKAITEVLKTIGKVRFEKTLENSHLKLPKKLANFKLVFEKRTCALEYKYPGDYNYSKLFIIKEYEMPEKGWRWENYRN
tara:strand:+ start:17 stop:283 length:267 start_codon:yes stop_codon:yes gene_type:complete